MDGLSLLLFAGLAGLGVSQAIEAYPRLLRVERVVVWWWAAVCVLCLANIISRRDAFIAAAGVLMSVLGFLVALNVLRIANQLATRETGIWIFRRKSSATVWRLCGLLLVLFGASWAFDPGQVS